MKVYQKIAHLLQAIDNCDASGNWEWKARHEETLANIERECLPHGSGFDAGCKILPDSTPQRLRISADWHRMNEGGYYCGWSSFVVVIRPCLLFDFQCTVKGRDWNQTKSYVSDTFHHAMNEEYKGD